MNSENEKIKIKIEEEEIDGYETNSADWEVTIKIQDLQDNENGNMKASKCFKNKQFQNPYNDITGDSELSSEKNEFTKLRRNIIKIEDELDFQDNEDDNLQPIIDCFDNERHFNSDKDDLSTEGLNYDEIVKPFKCDDCDERFFQESTLTQHKVIHKGLKCFQCKECGKYLTESFRIHQRTVLIELTPLICQVCGKSFGRKCHLNEHQRTVHDGIKPFKCKECGKCFAKKYDFTRHQRIVHDGIKPFECQECGKCFGIENNLKRHQRAVHEVIKSFQCQECGKCLQ